MPNVTKSVVLVSACDLRAFCIICDLLSENPAYPAFEKIELRTRIIIATFNLASEQISKRSVIQLLRYSLKRTLQMRNYFLCKCNFEVAM